MNYTKPPTNKDLTINRFGQLVQWRDNQEIINGSKGKTCLVGNLLYHSAGSFTISKNSFKGL